jgi:5-methylcytosine-specific restriction endonuclease McrA
VAKMRKYKREHQNDPCTYCGEHREQMSWDHIVPLSRGGLNATVNMVRCCVSCNGLKADRLISELPERWWELPRSASKKTRRRRQQRTRLRLARRQAAVIDYVLKPGDGFGSDYT